MAKGLIVTGGLFVATLITCAFFATTHFFKAVYFSPTIQVLDGHTRYIDIDHRGGVVWCIKTRDEGGYEREQIGTCSVVSGDVVCCFSKDKTYLFEGRWIAVEDGNGGIWFCGERGRGPLTLRFEVKYIFAFKFDEISNKS